MNGSMLKLKSQATRLQDNAESSVESQQTTASTEADVATGDSEATKKKKPQQYMARLTSKTKNLLKSAAAVYPRHTTGELLDKGLEALLGKVQPIYNFRLQSSDRQIVTAAKLAELG